MYWTLDETQSLGAGRLYMRDTATGQTIRLDLAEEGLAQPAKGEATFQIGNAEGTRAFFSDPQRLTATSTATPGKPDLYECQITEAGACELTDVTVDANVGESADVQGTVVGAAEDGSSIYFVASGAIATGATPGADNLYLAQAATNWTPRFVATLSSGDDPDWGSVKGRDNEVMNISARVSPSGQYLAFMSSEPLTGYDNTDVNETPGTTETARQHADEEVFLYNSAGTGSLSCPSCNPSGARPRGVFDTPEANEGPGLLVDRPETWSTQAAPNVDHWLAGSLPGWTRVSIKETLYQSRYLNDEGRLFFMSADPLDAAAAGETRSEDIGGTESQVGVENVYEYEPNGLGSCTSTAGCVSLITQGTADQESTFLDASKSGNDVFFVSADKLLPQDVDTAYDVYDARVCSEGSPCIVPPTEPPPPCETTESCRPGSSSTPGSEAPASSTFSGPGNTRHVVAETGVLGEIQKVKPKPQTTKQKLEAALKKCRKLPHKTRAEKRKRTTCETKAKKKYKVKKTTRRGAAR